MKKAPVAVGHEPIPFSVSRPRRHLPSTPLDLVRAKAVDRSLQRSSTDQTRITATVLCRLAMPETYEHPTISWRRADHLPHHETGSFLPSQMLPKVSVLCPFAPLSPRATYPYPNQCGLVQPCVVMNTARSHTFHLYSPTSIYASIPLTGPQVLLFAGMTGRGVLLPGCLEFHFMIFDCKLQSD